MQYWKWHKGDDFMSWPDDLKEREGFMSLTRADEAQVALAEKELSLKFAKDYRSYVMMMGAAIFDGHELTGVCSSDRLNVVSVTIEERKFASELPADCYVLEQTHIDGIVIWQDINGNIYRTIPGRKAEKIAGSIAEYFGC
jgi:hypothetical protein